MVLAGLELLAILLSQPLYAPASANVLGKQPRDLSSLGSWPNLQSSRQQTVSQGSPLRPLPPGVPFHAVPPSAHAGAHVVGGDPGCCTLSWCRAGRKQSLLRVAPEVPTPGTLPSSGHHKVLKPVGSGGMVGTDTGLCGTLEETVTSSCHLLQGTQPFGRPPAGMPSLSGLYCCLLSSMLSFLSPQTTGKLNETGTSGLAE